MMATFSRYEEKTRVETPLAGNLASARVDSEMIVILHPSACDTVGPVRPR
jgi:hypothetical protein